MTESIPSLLNKLIDEAYERTRRDIERLHRIAAHLEKIAAPATAVFFNSQHHDTCSECDSKRTLRVSLDTLPVRSGHIVACLNCESAYLFFVPMEACNHLTIKAHLLCECDTDSPGCVCGDPQYETPPSISD